jgi:hypothetical protein
MTNALRPSELFALRWKCFNYADSKMQVFETAYNGAIRPWGQDQGRVWDGFTCRKNWRRSFGFGSKSAQILHPMPSSFPMRKVGLWTPAIIENGCYLSWHETSGCPSCLSSDPAHDCHGWRKRRARSSTVKDVQGLLRHSRAATTTDVYMQETRRAFRQRSMRFMQSSEKSRNQCKPTNFLRICYQMLPIGERRLL